MERLKYGVIVVLAFLVMACSKDTEHKLEGKWQLQTVEANGEVIHADTVYYNFQNILFMYQVYIPAADSIANQFGFSTLDDETGLTLELAHDPRPVSSFLPRTDWDSHIRTFAIEKLSGKQLILNSEGKRYIFRKF